MNAEDIIWGGDTKLDFSLSTDLNVHEGSLVKIKHDEIKNSYYMETFRTNEISYIKGNKQDYIVFENLFNSNNGKAYILSRVLKYEDSKVLLQVKVFYRKISLTELQSLSISISDDIVNHLPERAKINPIQFLYNEFVFEDEESGQELSFTKSYNGYIDADFSLFSKQWILNVKQINNSYVAKKLVPASRNRSGDDYLAVIDGHISFENSTSSANVNTEFLKQINKISSDSEYFATWESYDKIEKLILLNQAQEKGILHYTDSKCELKNSYIYKLKIKDDIDFNFVPGDCLAFTDDERICNLRDFKSFDQIEAIKFQELGKYTGYSDGNIIIEDEQSSHKINIPKSGYLFLSLSGDAVRLHRRVTARNQILKHDSPIGLMAELIDGKANIELKPKNIIGLTSSVEKKFNRKFNEEQRDAIEMAMTTPDIGLILGPPGTGKTTVIKAIISRFEEYFRGSNHKNPRILVSSFQHEAIENVIVGIEENGLPSNRKGGKRGDDKKSDSLEVWRRETARSLETTIKELGGDADISKNPINDEIFAWKNKGENVKDGIEILNKISVSYRKALSQETIDEVERVIQKSSVTTESDSIESFDNKEKIQTLLNSLPKTIDEYNDLTRKEIRRFKTYIERQIINYEGDISFFENIFDTDGKDLKSFDKYLKLLDLVTSQYTENSSNEKESTNDETITELEELFEKISDELKLYELNKPENLNVRMAKILSEYKENLTDEMEVSRIVQKYSNISAATCQQALEVGRNAEKNPIYDLVIIDEAARANPLDLFIPMSMGKTVILVGDYLQLPHMLDPFVVKKIEKENVNEKLPILKESLFEKLYKQFESNKSLVCNRTVQLVHQYRMNKVLGDFANKAFYSPKNYKLDSEKVVDSEKQSNIGLFKNKPAVWLDINKKYGIEQGKISKYRNIEVKKIVAEIKNILKIDSNKQIGIISFYKDQSDKLNESLKDNLSESQLKNISCGTVDAFQGKEFDIVFLSCVRSNNGINQTNKDDLDIRRRYLGHITDVSRLCVSLTRAKQMLIVVGDSETVNYVPELEMYFNLCKSQDGYYESFTE